MAEFGAQLSSIPASSDSNLPSIFEVLAQESLFSTLQPAMRHVFRIAAERNPQRYSQLLIYCDELYAALQLVVETYYLKNYSASFSENFYGLRRVPQAGSNVPSDDLTHGNRLRSLAFLIAVPYVRTKCDRLFEAHSQSDIQTTETERTVGVKRLLCRVLLRVYPLMHSLWHAVILYYQLAYTFGVERCHSPLLRLARLTLRHLTVDEMAAKQTQQRLREMLHNKTWLLRAFIVLSRLLSVASVVLSTGLSVGVFFLQFLDWWHSSDQRAAVVMALPTPQPPLDNLSLLGGSGCRLSAVCPLCNKLRTNDTALAVSGFVFCYPCILQFIKEKGCCPVTGYPAQADQLTRLYQWRRYTSAWQVI